MLDVTINGRKMSVEEGTTILEAAKKAGAHIPTLCHLDLHSIRMVNKVGTCRVCVVEIEGGRGLAPSCSTSVTDGMVVNTNTTRSIQARRAMVELFLSNHPTDCLVCARNQNCELQSLAAELGIREVRYGGKRSEHAKDASSRSLVRDPNKCVLCRRCETMCNEVQTVGVYSCVNRGFDTVMGTAFNLPIAETSCTFCGQCVSVCPTGALTEVDNTKDVWEAIDDPDKFVIVQTAPAVRAALGESFGMDTGARVTGKMISALRLLGFDKVYDTDFAADLTVVEEATEFLGRLNGAGRLPILTSCCPAWVRFIEHQFPDLLDVPSTCKSPHEMFGAVAKSYLAEKLGVGPENMVVVSVMPCLTKKYEAARPELAEGRLPNVDLVLSTRELAYMIREAGLNFPELPEGDFDRVMGQSTGAGVIFGATGGVIEAALRTAASYMGEPLENVEFHQLRGMDGIRDASVTLAGRELKIGIANGLGNSRKLLERIQAGASQYHAIEIMACPGGCVGGGGQPYHGNDLRVIGKRAEALYAEDADKKIRASHENPEIMRLYAEFLGEPGGRKARELLHTTYTKRA